MQIGRLILRRRKELHLTQDALAVGICSTSYLSKIENGQVTPHTEVLSALLKRLGLDPDLARETDKREMEFDDQLRKRQIKPTYNLHRLREIILQKE
ncbi:helix-turn-helix domain-containing protein [Thermicanus aegyptius]|uniref:helix-turn-helix domain-containing protein n=1 Tax=Thermicanus aegyptius TaxID=94009 RepID=UPI000406B49C|nr:helix-turn-helix transcriptional regulator [Thermicanus aegyptius]